MSEQRDDEWLRTILAAPASDACPKCHGSGLFIVDSTFAAIGGARRCPKCRGKGFLHD